MSETLKSLLVTKIVFTSVINYAKQVAINQLSNMRLDIYVTNTFYLPNDHNPSWVLYTLLEFDVETFYTPYANHSKKNLQHATNIN
jgi:hypothetical protein